ncbi:MAG TPA: hypothetical protein VKV19_08395 [Ktedonobacteraceae bacterium]|nr:hypothetical protein [Ktedonobacteraceae bacterium]
MLKVNYSPHQMAITLTTIPADVAYFHAQWRRSNPLGNTEAIL